MGVRTALMMTGSFNGTLRVISIRFAVEVF